MHVLEPKFSLGLYADSSAVYINACLIKTDGLDILTDPISLTRPYSPELREKLLHLKYPDDVANAELMTALNRDLVAEHAAVAEELLAEVSRHIPHVDIVGYSGHLVHLGLSDKQAVLWGSGTDLAKRLKLPVINRFIQTDVQAGGTGHPILSTFWEAVTRERKKPVAILGLSGITSLTYIGELGEQYAFDVGVGCLLLDRWLKRHADIEMDFDGTWAEKGDVDERLLSYLLKTPYLAQKPPKALDRSDFNHLLAQIEGCSPADGAATITAFIVESILSARKFLPHPPQEWILTGGGALNPAIVLRLKKQLGGQISTISEINMPHYNLNAAGYAFLAVRSLMGLPITFPTTTGVPEPISGGLFHGREG
ncbi:MAG: anhydro-N-acetylmuramic acid kinase [Pseudomonadota bacterium]|nr:anhydro-N-acetylmuramic acid kinase [Pseudomonadota bacterium]